MTSRHSHSKDTKPEYVPNSNAQQHFGWSPETYYSQTPGHPSSNQPYYVQPGPMMMEPVYPMAGYNVSSPSMNPASPHYGIPHHYDVHGPQRHDQAYQYSPPVPGFPPTPAFSSPPTPSLQFSGRLSPSASSPSIQHNANLPEDVRNALASAFESPEFARGENVPPEILMPTVLKVDKELWECRICGKEHKRRDHTLTHVRTAHLSNKGFRCQFPGCDSAFGRKGDLERHVSSHQNTEPADSVCPNCHAQLHRKDNLIRHMKSCKASSSSSHYHDGSARASSSGMSRSSRRNDPSVSYSSAPYPTPVSRPKRSKHSTTTQPQPRSPQFQSPITSFYSPSDAYYDRSGLGLIDAASLTMPQPWQSVLAPYDYSSYDLGDSTRWV